MNLSRVKIGLVLLNQRMTKSQLAKLTGLSRNTISAVCNGKSCSEATAVAIAKALDVPLDMLKEGG